jgi:hypothetical protein
MYSATEPSIDRYNEGSSATYRTVHMISSLLNMYNQIALLACEEFDQEFAS